MDIVHLIETKIIKSSMESSHTYAEIEHTISLDHSEGMDNVEMWFKHQLFIIYRIEADSFACLSMGSTQ